MPSSGDLYTAPAGEVDYELVRDFVVSVEAASLFSESLTLEVKEKLSKGNVAEAVAALGNTDGGIVLVGVKDKDATGEDRIVGVPKAEHDSVASSLHSLIPEAKPEIIPVAIPGTDRLVLVLRVDADAVPHPVVVSGKVLTRIPGHSVPADRRRILDLAARDQAPPGAEHARMNVDRRPWQPKEIDLWPWLRKGDSRQPYRQELRVGVLRVAGGLELPRRALDRPWLGPEACQAALDALNGSPLQRIPAWSMESWDWVESRAAFLWLGTHGKRQSRDDAFSIQYGTHLHLAGRKLSMLIGIEWTAGRLESGVTMERFYHAILGAMITIASTCAHTAHAAGIAEPSSPLDWEAWLQPEDGRSVTDVVNGSGIDPHNGDRHDDVDLSTAHFPAARTSGTAIEDLDKLAREWLTCWVLDTGTPPSEFAWTGISGWARPDFLRMPDLALSSASREAVHDRPPLHVVHRRLDFDRDFGSAKHLLLASSPALRSYTRQANPRGHQYCSPESAGVGESGCAGQAEQAPRSG